MLLQPWREELLALQRSWPYVLLGACADGPLAEPALTPEQVLEVYYACIFDPQLRLEEMLWLPPSLGLIELISPPHLESAVLEDPGSPLWSSRNTTYTALLEQGLAAPLRGMYLGTALKPLLTVHFDAATQTVVSENMTPDNLSGLVHDRARTASALLAVFDLDRGLPGTGADRRPRTLTLTARFTLTTKTFRRAL